MMEKKKQEISISTAILIGIISLVSLWIISLPGKLSSRLDSLNSFFTENQDPLLLGICIVGLNLVLIYTFLSMATGLGILGSKIRGYYTSKDSIKGRIVWFVVWLVSFFTLTLIEFSIDLGIKSAAIEHLIPKIQQDLIRTVYDSSVRSLLPLFPIGILWLLSGLNLSVRGKSLKNMNKKNILILGSYGER